MTKENGRLCMFLGGIHKMKKTVKTFVVLLMFSMIMSGLFGTYAEAASGKTPDKANTLTISKETTDSVKKTSAVRWYKVNVDKEGILTLSVTSKELKQNGALYLYYGDPNRVETSNQSQFLTYDKSKKTQTVMLTSETAVSKGTYYVCFRTSADTLKKKAQFTIKATLKSKSYDDIEPNQKPENAQKVTMKDIKESPVTYRMNVNSGSVNTDTIDRFRVTLSGKKGIVVKVKSAGEGTIRVMLYKGDNKKLLNESEVKQYLSPNGKTKELVFGTSKVQTKGKYSIAVLLQDTDNCFMDYEISVSTFEPVTSIKANDMPVGKTEVKKLPVTINKEATEPLTYKSSNTKVATVDGSGNVTGIGKGMATITVKGAYTGKKTTCNVTVTDIPVNKITLSNTSKTLTKGGYFTLSATVSPDNAANKAVEYVSSNTKVATVGESGKVTAVSEGTATITVKAKDGSGVNATCKVTVKAPYTPKPDPQPTETPQPTVNGANNVKVGGSITLNASHSGGSWSASNGNVSLSTNGSKCTVTGKTEGTVRVTYTLNGKSAGISIYVKG